MFEKIYYRVKLAGEVTLEASSESDAIARARDYFVNTGHGLAWGVEAVKVQIEPAGE